jgi:hypothetical protein
VAETEQDVRFDRGRLPCLGRTRASGWGDPPWVDSWATASKAASERLPSLAIICSGMSCRSGSMMDLLAERVVQLGGTAEGTIQVAAKRTELKEYPLHISGERDHIDAVRAGRLRQECALRHRSDRRARRQGHRRYRHRDLARCGQVSLIRRGTYRVVQRGEEEEGMVSQTRQWNQWPRLFPRR